MLSRSPHRISIGMTPFIIIIIHSLFPLEQTPPTEQEAGFCDQVFVSEVGDTPVVIFQQGKSTDCHAKYPQQKYSTPPV